MSPYKVLQERSMLLRYPLLMYPEIPVDDLNEIISHIKPGVTFVAVDPVPSTHLSRLFNVALSDQTIFLLSIPPIFGVRVLRQERRQMLGQIALIIYLNNIQFDSTSSSIKLLRQIRSDDAPRLSGLSRLIPNLLKYSLEEKGLTIPYILSSPTEGALLSTTNLYLSIPERRNINHQLGILSRVLSIITPPNQEFGLAADVLSPLVPTSRTKSSGAHGSSTWSHAFAVLLESAMRDAEDMLVNLPYHEIRRYVRDYSHYFDEIKVPRLLVTNITDPDNVMIVRDEPARGSDGAERGGADVVGLRDWSRGIFGDPLLADIWEELRGNVDGGGFLDGWRDVVVENDEKEGCTEFSTSNDGEIGKKFRELMYICYRAVVTIATEFQRPRPTSMKIDDAGRMRLTSALKELRALEPVLNA